MAEYLATGFAGVDRAADPQAYVSCLRLLSAFPEVRDYKAASMARLGLGPGMRALEVGCGLGEEAAAMAARVGPRGLAVALDASLGMLGRLRAGTSLASVAPIAGDALRLPFAAGTFDACRVDRTLQHVPDPGGALGEMARVLRPGGRLAAVEPDWGTFVVDSEMRGTARTLAAFWCDSFRCGWVGRQLPRLMAQSGLAGITVDPRPFVLRRLEDAEAVYNLCDTARRAVAAGRIDAAEAAAFADEQRRFDAAGRFFACLTFFLVTGVKRDG